MPVSKWQSVNVRGVATPKLEQLPKRLVTSLTWASMGEDLMADDGTPFWLQTYKGMGFNTVPQVSMPSNFVRWTKDNTTLAPLPTAPPYVSR